MRIGRRLVVHGLMIVAVMSCCGCGMISRNFPTMQNPEPVVRARSIARSDRRPNSRDVATLVGRLEDPDPVVRLTAHEDLRRRTGRDFGFVPWGSPEERAAAIGRWRSWLAGPPRPAEPGRTTKPSPSPVAPPRGTITEDP